MLRTLYIEKYHLSIYCHFYIVVCVVDMAFKYLHIYTCELKANGCKLLFEYDPCTFSREMKVPHSKTLKSGIVSIEN